ncbi:antibiotic biosynthesis monooxygenase family protein [Desulfoluna spongiiphila]|uniref:Heme-degrading monooxygenase HmoA n=1 Tax=Desulfoluna spongiiphila TaxID=419481 RepID=A0A1G5CSX2_9BACT|nr:antibiotic biosynthesis monooxygenase [Desulfoluna spongiiphila]SCY05649.1 Heme-degrading monooxygenase HmoA [Desulfoluna spongiiphila]VVS92398.1 dimeric alpha-beta barrel [Desulfoluna spongiiphila]
MFAVIFEVTPKEEGKARYLKIASEIRGFLESRRGFISIERFASLNDEGKLLSLSFWEDEDAIEEWRTMLDHRTAQKTGRDSLFTSYRIRVAEVVRDYTHDRRDQAPG